MPGLQRISTSTSAIDVLDRILDKGIVIDAWVRVSFVGIDLLTMEARVVVASIETYLSRADAVGRAVPTFTTLNQGPVLPHPPTRSPRVRRPVAANLRARKH
jgi:hypothetical protein